MPLATVANRGAAGCTNRIFYNNNRAFCRQTEYARPTAEETYKDRLHLSDEAFDIINSLAGPGQLSVGARAVAARAAAKLKALDLAKKVKKSYDAISLK